MIHVEDNGFLNVSGKVQSGSKVYVGSLGPKTHFTASRGTWPVWLACEACQPPLELERRKTYIPEERCVGGLQPETLVSSGPGVVGRKRGYLGGHPLSRPKAFK